MGYDAGMGVELLTERHATQIAGVLGCYDRMLIFGTLPGICQAGGMTSFLYAHQIRIFDYPKFAEPYRDQIRENAERMAKAAGIEIELIRTRSIRKEDRAQELLRSFQPEEYQTTGFGNSFIANCALQLCLNCCARIEEACACSRSPA